MRQYAASYFATGQQRLRAVDGKCIGFSARAGKEKENQAILALGKANSELEDYYKQVAQIEQYRLDYCQQLVDRGKGGLSASEYGHLNRFLTQLDETLT